MGVRPLGRCCDCRWLGTTSLGALCEASLPDWASDVLMKVTGSDEGSMGTLDVLKVRRCDCFEPWEKADA